MSIEQSFADDATQTEGCYWCGRELIFPTKRSWSVLRNGRLATRDHVIARCNGGQRLVWSCLACNQVKGDMLAEQWLRFTRAIPKERIWAMLEEKRPRGQELFWATIEEGIKL